MDQKANAQFNHQTAHGCIDSLGPLHNIREEDHHEYSGREAKQAIFNRLTNSPKAQILLLKSVISMAIIYNIMKAVL